MWHISFTKILYMNDNGFLNYEVTKIQPNPPPPQENFNTITSKPILGWYMDQPLVSTMVSNTIPPWYQIPNLSWSFNVQVNYGYYSYYIYLLIYLLLSKFIRYMLIQLHTHSIFSNCIYHTIYTPYVKKNWFQFAYGIKILGYPIN